MKFSVQDIANLRKKTGMPMMECKKALEEAGGDENKALEILKKRGADKALKKAERETKAGLIEVYSHNGRIGVMVEVLCETDFVVRNEEFKQLAHDIALQVAAMEPGSVDDLLGQSFIKDESKTTGDLINEKIAKIGERILVSRFIRYELGEVA